MGQNFEDRLADARSDWPTSTGRPALHVVATSNSLTDYCNFSLPTSPNQINVLYKDLQAGPIGADDGATGIVCGITSGLGSGTNGPYMYRADLVVDTNPDPTDSTDWWTNSLTSGIADYYDLESVLTQELGHALGWLGHFTYLLNN